MRIERLTEQNAGAYRALMLEGYALHPDAFTSSVAERAALPAAWWAQRLAAGDDVRERVFGALDGGTLVGAAGLALETRALTLHKATLFGMYVPAAARGRGIGRALVLAVLAAARARPQIRVVQLTVTQGNGAAAALYARCGFTPFGVEPLAVATAGGYVAKVHMWLDLAAPAAPGS